MTFIVCSEKNHQFGEPLFWLTLYRYVRCFHHSEHTGQLIIKQASRLVISLDLFERIFNLISYNNTYPSDLSMVFLVSDFSSDPIPARKLRRSALPMPWWYGTPGNIWNSVYKLLILTVVTACSRVNAIWYHTTKETLMKLMPRWTSLIPSRNLHRCSDW